MSEDSSRLIRSFGMRATPQRLAVLEVLRDSFDHPSAEEIWRRVKERLPSVSFATVYKILGELKVAGQARALPVPGKARFDFGGRRPHHHLVCERCGRTEDVRGSRADPSALLPKRNGFRVVGVEMTFRGVCPECQSKERREQPVVLAASNRSTRRAAG